MVVVSVPPRLYGAPGGARDQGPDDALGQVLDVSGRTSSCSPVAGDRQRGGQSSARRDEAGDDGGRSRPRAVGDAEAQDRGAGVRRGPRRIGRRARPRACPPCRGGRAARALLPVLRGPLRTPPHGPGFGIPYGPRARPAAVIPSFVRRALDGTPLTIAGTGEQERSLVYVEDLAEGVAGPWSRAPPGARTTSAARRRRPSAGWPRWSGAGGRRADRAHRGPGRRPDGRRSAATAPSRSSLDGLHPLAEGVARYVAWLRAQPEERPAPRTPRPGELARRPARGPVMPRRPHGRAGWPAAWRSSPSCPAC